MCCPAGSGVCVVLPVARRHDGLRWFGVVVLWAEAPGRSSPARPGGPAARPSFCSPFWFGRLVLIHVLLSPCLVQSLFRLCRLGLFIYHNLRRVPALGIHPGTPVPRLSTLDSAPALRVAGGIVPILSFVYWVEFAVLRKI